MNAMPTTKVEYTPAAPAPTTTVLETFPTTTFVCTVTSADMPNLKARKDESIPIPKIGFDSPQGSRVRLVRIVIVAVPASTDGVLKVGDSVLANGAQISPQSNGSIYFVPVKETFDGATFTYKVVTNCGESSTMTGTIGVSPDLPSPCNCD
jgi:hypothetical protein